MRRKPFKYEEKTAERLRRALADPQLSDEARDALADALLEMLKASADSPDAAYDLFLIANRIARAAHTGKGMDARASRGNLWTLLCRIEQNLPLEDQPARRERPATVASGRALTSEAQSEASASHMQNRHGSLSLLTCNVDYLGHLNIRRGDMLSLCSVGDETEGDLVAAVYDWQGRKYCVGFLGITSSFEMEIDPQGAVTTSGDDDDYEDGPAWTFKAHEARLLGRVVDVLRDDQPVKPRCRLRPVHEV